MVSQQQRIISDVSKYWSEEKFEEIKVVAEKHADELPILILDLKRLKDTYEELVRAFPRAHVYYAIKANPTPQFLRLLIQLGSNFDIASVPELERVISCGGAASRCSYGNTIKKAKDVKRCYELGVRLFATDHESDLKNIALQAPGSRVYVRVLALGTSDSADWPLSRKFGCDLPMAKKLLLLAKELGLNPVGVSFHVGSQQRDVDSWRNPLREVHSLFEELKAEGLHLTMINLGGGFPAHYVYDIEGLETYAKAIDTTLLELFGPETPEIMIEPGRSLAGDCGVLVSEVVLVSRKTDDPNAERWVYTDCGKFGGFIETIDECIKYPLVIVPKQEVAQDLSDDEGEVVIAGPTCDSCDILYDQSRYVLPNWVKSGDRFFWLGTGAYTTTYASVWFNGFPPLKEFVIPLNEEEKILPSTIPSSTTCTP